MNTNYDGIADALLLFQANSPVGVELEMIVMDWMCRSLGLPDHFLHGGMGGGVITVNTQQTGKGVFQVKMSHDKMVSFTVCK